MTAPPLPAPGSGRQPTAYAPLLAPEDAALTPLGLPDEIRMARETLAEAEVANIHDSEAMLRAAVGCMMRLRSLVEAAEAVAQ
ncbi:hypothetical protein SZN_09486 [Streptomyces zinciresistens K42]|uniref:Uncharacterized protein n=1 Tax=Streptomyces zinciresistens K42 TaxID=700597 RepID=G2G8S9_9ACTN|nr:hypothetical protein [Streptomyces zinciresistens]EGX60144.1 hypothetical protein SZN_09486 [Streptomyces zinciresistens K42]